MRRSLSSACVFGVLAAVAGVLFPAAVHAAEDPCAYDREAMLALDEQAFDQTLPDGGWRRLANIPECQAAAADLIAAYRAVHPGVFSTVVWHEGQMRANAGQNARAIELLAAARKPPAEDIAGWNLYVDATVAFLANDREALQRARDALAAVPYPQDAGLPPLKDGFIEFPSREGQPPIRMPWPTNLDVVDGLLRCFGKPYSEAYGSAACRSGP